ncbi:GNAT family N-acetyltransferase [Streptomyces sp. NRRL WC-3744]|uniref:GNAT family N-acetyltransferase n=1 Tax=Streptomyces sp. NRRL WC-3744 TaxID=1463935 RepID=UPI003B63B4E8
MHRAVAGRPVSLPSSSRSVGSVGLFWPPSRGTVEIGYGVVASRRGRGYATEATRALLSDPASIRPGEGALPPVGHGRPWPAS